MSSHAAGFGEAALECKGAGEGILVYGRSKPEVAGETGREGETARDCGRRGTVFEGPDRDEGLLSSEGRFTAEYGLWLLKLPFGVESVDAPLLSFSLSAASGFGELALWYAWNGFLNMLF